MTINKLKAFLIKLFCLLMLLQPATHGMEEPRETNGWHIPGMISAYAGDSLPDGCGWLMCDGKEYSSKDYPRLWEVLKTKFYEDPEEKFKVLQLNEEGTYQTFRVPDFRGRIPVGVDGGVGRVLYNNTLGKSGGAETVTLTIDQMPKHSHDVKFASGSAGNYLGVEEKFRLPSNYDFDIQASYSGKNQPHNNMQPFLTVNYIIKY